MFILPKGIIHLSSTHMVFHTFFSSSFTSDHLEIGVLPTTFSSFDYWKHKKVWSDELWIFAHLKMKVQFPIPKKNFPGTALWIQRFSHLSEKLYLRFRRLNRGFEFKFKLISISHSFKVLVVISRLIIKFSWKAFICIMVFIYLYLYVKCFYVYAIKHKR